MKRTSAHRYPLYHIAASVTGPCQRCRLCQDVLLDANSPSGTALAPGERVVQAMEGGELLRLVDGYAEDFAGPCVQATVSSPLEASLFYGDAPEAVEADR